MYNWPQHIKISRSLWTLSNADNDNGPFWTLLWAVLVVWWAVLDNAMGRFGKFLGIKIFGAVLAMGRFCIAPNNLVCRHTCLLLPFSYSYSTALRLHNCVKIRTKIDKLRPPYLWKTRYVLRGATISATNHIGHSKTISATAKKRYRPHGKSISATTISATKYTASLFGVVVSILLWFVYYSPNLNVKPCIWR